MSTLLIQIKACLNSRPISTLSQDPTDLQPLTRGHFIIIIGDALTDIPGTFVCKRKVNSHDLISPGNHVDRFGFKLPQGLPTSFVNKEAKVRYEIEAVMERGWKPIVKARVPFTITGCLDLNKIAGIAERVGFRVTRNLSCFFCTKGMVGFEVAIPKQGFVCGEYIELNAEMFKQSRKHVHGFVASLVQ
ncbi:unnamed protein product, partial [Allacma fusca]